MGKYSILVLKQKINPLNILSDQSLFNLVTKKLTHSCFVNFTGVTGVEDICDAVAGADDVADATDDSKGTTWWSHL